MCIVYCFGPSKLLTAILAPLFLFCLCVCVLLRSEEVPGKKELRKFADFLTHEEDLRSDKKALQHIIGHYRLEIVDRETRRPADANQAAVVTGLNEKAC